MPVETPHLRIRLEPRLLARVEKARETSGRTLTGEIAERLRQSFDNEFHKEDMRAVAQEAATMAVGMVTQLLRADAAEPEARFTCAETMFDWLDAGVA